MSKKLLAAVAVLGGPDALSAPIVGASPTEVLAGKTETTGTATETVVESDEETDEEGTTTSTTTTTTTETEYSGESEDEPEEEDEEEPAKEEEAVIAARSTSTTRDVLAAVRRLTGATTLGAQLGALQAMHANAARADKLAAKLARVEAASRKATIASKVTSAIKAGLITPAQRAWAIATGTKDETILDGYLANAKPVLAAPVRMPAPKVNGVAANADGLTADEARIAKELGVDPAKLAAFKASGGVTPSITH